MLICIPASGPPASATPPASPPAGATGSGILWSVNEGMLLSPLLAGAAADLLLCPSAVVSPLPLALLQLTRPALAYGAGGAEGGGEGGDGAGCGASARGFPLLTKGMDPWIDLGLIQDGRAFRATVLTSGGDEAQQRAEEAAGAGVGMARLTRLPEGIRGVMGCD